jgi:2-dehydropantoate 2-reductase
MISGPAPEQEVQPSVRYLIIGAGAIGGTIGALLHESGREVVLVARGAHLEALRSTGLRFTTPRGLSVLDIPAIGGPAEIELQPDDVLMLCVKSQDTAAVLERWANRPVAGGGLAGDRLPVVCVQNGVENERVALRRFAQVYAMTVMLPASHLEPGSVTAISDPVVGALVFGRYPEGVDPVAERIAAELADSRLIASVVARPQRWKYAKLLRNLANAIEAVGGSIKDDEAAARLRTMAIDEAVAVLAAAGIDHAGAAEQAVHLDQLVWNDVPGAPRHGGSSWQSLARGTGSIETAYLNGEIVLLGRLHQVETPVNALLQRLAESAAANGTAPGSIAPAEILERLVSASAE